ncbi:MAG TPA: DUF3618 domain-containing protein [Gaiellaceae bacterium]|jgi:hypothetical protein
MTSPDELRTEIAAEREQLASAVGELRSDVSKIKARLPVAGAAFAALGALRIALKLRKR